MIQFFRFLIATEKNFLVVFSETVEKFEGGFHYVYLFNVIFSFLISSSQPTVFSPQSSVHSLQSTVPLPTADCRLPTANCRLPTADCRLPTADCQLPTVFYLYFSGLLIISFNNFPISSERSLKLINSSCEIYLQAREKSSQTCVSEFSISESDILLIK